MLRSGGVGNASSGLSLWSHDEQPQAGVLLYRREEVCFRVFLELSPWGHAPTTCWCTTITTRSIVLGVQESAEETNVFMTATSLEFPK